MLGIESFHTLVEKSLWHKRGEQVWAIENGGLFHLWISPCGLKQCALELMHFYPRMLNCYLKLPSTPTTHSTRVWAIENGGLFHLWISPCGLKQCALELIYKSEEQVPIEIVFDMLGFNMLNPKMKNHPPFVLPRLSNMQRSQHTKLLRRNKDSF